MRKVIFAAILALVGVQPACSEGAATPDPQDKPAAGSTGEAADCCSCAFTETRIFPGNRDFQCSFAYPANWEVRYDKWENKVYVKAPRCAQRCEGARSMMFSISRGKDNNVDEQETLEQGIMTPVGNVSCGGRKSIVFRPPGTTLAGKSGAISFHVGNNDDKAYDAHALFSCPNPGEWQELQRLFIDSVE